MAKIDWGNPSITSLSIRTFPQDPTKNIVEFDKNLKTPPPARLAGKAKCEVKPGQQQTSFIALAQGSMMAKFPFSVDKDGDNRDKFPLVVRLGLLANGMLRVSRGFAVPTQINQYIFHAHASAKVSASAAVVHRETGRFIVPWIHVIPERETAHTIQESSQQVALLLVDTTKDMGVVEVDDYELHVAADFDLVTTSIPPQTLPLGYNWSTFVPPVAKADVDMISDPRDVRVDLILG